MVRATKLHGGSNGNGKHDSRQASGRNGWQGLRQGPEQGRHRRAEGIQARQEHGRTAP